MKRAALITACCYLLAAGWLLAAEVEPAPAFSLPRRGAAGQEVSLSDLKGRIVVLDFFAH
jgi:cytochrome oxidase Cu insertion factor (SCO1/SenC/PrrC family)